MPFINGAQGRGRTADTAIFSHMLYQLSYLGTGWSGWLAHAVFRIKPCFIIILGRHGVAAC